MTPPAVRVEVCVDSVESALAAQAGGAARVELCDDLLEGGTTPSAGMIAACCEALALPTFVMIRPRGGDFVYSDAELDVMRRDVELAGRLGARGVVFGLLRPDGSVDAERVRVLVEAARPLSVTFHRAFDRCRDPDEALETLAALGVDRVLTSGGAPTAVEGRETLARLVRRSAGRVGILAGGGVREENVARIVGETGVREVHLRANRRRPGAMRYRNPSLPADDEAREVTDEAMVARLVRLLGERRP